MVANIRSCSSPGGVLRYNKEKVDKDEAEVLFWQKMPESFDKRSKTPWARTTQGMSSDNC